MNKFESMGAVEQIVRFPDDAKTDVAQGASRMIAEAQTAEEVASLVKVSGMLQDILSKFKPGVGNE